MLLLAGQLPEDSALHGALRGGPQFRTWTSQTHMLAAMVNLLGAANSQRAGKRGRVLIKPPVKKRVLKRTTRVSHVGARAAAALNRLRG